MNKAEEMGEVLSDKRSILSSLKSMIETPAWKYYTDALAQQKRFREGTVLLKPLGNINEILAQEFLKGEVSGLFLSQVFAGTLIDTLEHEVKRLEFEQEKLDEYSSNARPEPTSRVDDPSFDGS